MSLDPPKIRKRKKCDLCHCAAALLQTSPPKPQTINHYSVIYRLVAIIYLRIQTRNEVHCICPPRCPLFLGECRGRHTNLRFCLWPRKLGFLGHSTFGVCWWSFQPPNNNRSHLALLTPCFRCHYSAFTSKELLVFLHKYFRRQKPLLP